jgi:hypothetical protein
MVVCQFVVFLFEMLQSKPEFESNVATNSSNIL